MWVWGWGSVIPLIGHGLIGCGARWQRLNVMRFHISHQLQRYKWWTNILIVLGRQECLHLSEHVLYWSLVVQTFGALPGLVWLVYLRLRCTHTRSGGPSLRQSARYPSAFAKWVADQHANCMDSWLNMQHCVPASWLVWLLAIYSHRANKWDTHAYTHYNIYIYNCKSYIYIYVMVEVALNILFCGYKM